MNWLVLFGGLALVCAAAHAHDDFDDFIVKFKKDYKSPQEYEFRRKLFLESKRAIDEFNAMNQDESYQKVIDSESDMSPDEFASLYGLNNFLKEDDNIVNSPQAEEYLCQLYKQIAETNIPDELDWRNHSRVTRVKKQKCGTCWAYAATGALEGQMFGRMEPLSEQNLIDCCVGCPRDCDAGWYKQRAWDDIMARGGIMSERDYPQNNLTGAFGQCKFNKSKVIFNLSGYAHLERGNEELLKKVVAVYGPVAVSVHTVVELWLQYSLYPTPVFFHEGCSSEMTNHAVLIVGYGTDKKFGDYWLVKNSWGPNFGINGYIKMARNRKNFCGIATRAMIPII